MTEPTPAENPEQPIKGLPATRKVRLYDAEGKPWDVLPVDAHEILVGGEYFADNPLLERADGSVHVPAEAEQPAL